MFYDMACPSCGFELHDVRKTLAEYNKGVYCPKCNERMFSIIEPGGDFILRGNNWYSKKKGAGRTK